MQTETPDRLKHYLSEIGKKYPGCWRHVDDLRASRGKGLPEWPAWCFLPLAGGFAVASGGKDPMEALRLNPTFAADISRIGALAAWRVTQGIYRFHEEIFKAIWDTPLEDELPVDLLFHLPEWCVYVETPGRQWAGGSLQGFFAHLEWDANDSRQELRLLLDTKGELVGVPLHLAGSTIQGAIERAQQTASFVASSYELGAPALSKDNQQLLGMSIKPLVSLVLYLCSIGSELRDRGGSSALPRNPEPVKTKNGQRSFPAEKQKIWEVGYRIGAALQRAYEKERGAGTGEGTHSGPGPHIRRAHWHSFWTGQKKAPEARRLKVKWLPPIPVAVGDAGDLMPTIHPVK